MCAADTASDGRNFPRCALICVNKIFFCRVRRAAEYAVILPLGSWFERDLPPVGWPTDQSVRPRVLLRCPILFLSSVGSSFAAAPSDCQSAVRVEAAAAAAVTAVTAGSSRASGAPPA